MADDIFLSVVIPAYNEADKIEKTLSTIVEYLKNRYSYEIIVVDDGSKDRTSEIIKKAGERNNRISLICFPKNRGKGAAVKEGVLNAKGDIILFSDADLSTPIEEFEKLKKAIDKGYDIAIGSRGLPDSKIVVPQPWCRRHIGKMFPYLVRLIIMKNFKDTQCGFKLFKKEVGKVLFSELKTKGFAFDVEILYRAVKKYCKIKEVSITWSNSLQSKVTIFREPFKMLYSICKINILYQKECKIKRNRDFRKNNSIFMPEDHMDNLYNSTNLMVRFIHNNRLNTILKLIPKQEGLRILDAGCGEGHLISKMLCNNQKNVFFGVDITKIALEKAIQRCPSARFMEGNILCLKDFQDESFDVIICTEVLEHILEHGKAIREMKRILKKGGILIITFPNEKLWTIGRFFLGRRPVKVPDHINSFTPQRIIKEVNLKCINRKNLPFNLPFFISLCEVIEFKK